MMIARPSRTLAALLLGVAGFAAAAGALECQIVGDRITLKARREPLENVLQEFSRVGIRVKVDPGIDARVSGNLIDEPINGVLDELLEKFSYALVWDVIDGPLGPMPKLSEIQVFRRHHGPARLTEWPRPDEDLTVVTGPTPDGPAFVKDEVLLSFKPGTRLEDFKRLIQQIGGSVIASVPALGIYQVRLPAGVNIPALVEQLQQWDIVAGVEPNYVVQTPAPLRVGEAGAFPEAVSVAALAGAPPVAVLDSGLSSAPGLDGLVVGQLDALNPDRMLQDPSGHGTQMALIASGAIRPDGSVAPDADRVPLLAVRAFDNQGYASSFSLMRSMEFAISRGARVINMSWGTDTDSRFIRNAVRYAQDRGAVVVASAGNVPTGQPVYPAAYPGVVAVTALDADGALWNKSNYGDFAFLAAPGRAHFPVGHKGPPGAYAGTSISSAFTARALSLYFAANPKASAKDAVTALRNALTDAGPTGKDNKYGYGALDKSALNRFLASANK
jgi:thermitase